MAVLKILLLLNIVPALGILFRKSTNENNELLFCPKDIIPSDSTLDSNWTATCPQWPYYENCYCPLNQTFLCCMQDPGTSVTLYIVACSCVTYKEPSKGLKHSFEFGFCMYNCSQSNDDDYPGYHAMPSNISHWNDFECGEYHRTGTLCGSCDEDNGYYQRVYTFNMSCIHCAQSRNTDWIKYLLSAYLPLTVFCLIVLFFKINVHSSALQGFVIFCQLMSLPSFGRFIFLVTQNHDALRTTAKFLGTVLGVWNLDFFRTYYAGYCLRLGSLATLSLEFAIAAYPLILMVVMYYLVTFKNDNVKILVLILKPFQWFSQLFLKKWKVQTSAIDCFSTFFFLSYMKFISASFDILIPVKVYQFTDPKLVHYVWRLYYDATIPYLQGAHLYYSILAIMVLIICAFFPISLLLLYPYSFYQRCLGKFPNRCVLPLHVFVDSFQGCYKDGTEPDTRDCRWFSAVLLMFRFMYFTTVAVTPTEAFIPFMAIGCVFLIILVTIVDPFKTNFSHFTQNLTVYILLAAVLGVTLLCLSKRAEDFSTNMFLVFAVAAAALSVVLSLFFVFRWILANRKFKFYQ